MVAMGAEGFVASHKNRLAVFKELLAGEGNAERIAKRQRIVGAAVDSALNDLEGHDLIRETSDGYELTEEGERVAEQLRKENLVG